MITPDEARNLVSQSEKESGLSGKLWYRNVYLKSEHWKNLRTQRLIIANKKCEQCSDVYYLDVHHLSYKNIFDVTVEDLRVLCRICHNKEHGIVTNKNVIKKLEKTKTSKEKELKQAIAYIPVIDKSLQFKCLLRSIILASPNGSKKWKKDWSLLFIAKNYTNITIPMLNELLRLTVTKKAIKKINEIIKLVSDK